LAGKKVRDLDTVTSLNDADFFLTALNSPETTNKITKLNALASKEDITNKGASSGYAGLDALQKLLLANFPVGNSLEVLRRNAGNTALEFAVSVNTFTLGNLTLSNFASNRVTSCYGSDSTASPFNNGQMSLPFDVKLTGFTVTFDTPLGSAVGIKLVENSVIPVDIIGTIPDGVNFVSITLDETITANTPFGFTSDSASSINGRNPTWIFEKV